LLVLLVFTACSCQDEDGKIQEKPSPFEQFFLHPLDAHLDEKHTDDLPGMLERKHIRVLTTFNRTNFFIARDEFYGFAYSLLKDYEKHLNRKLSRRELKVMIEFIPVSRDMLIPALNEGLGDIAAAGLTITPARQEKVDFTLPYLEDVDEVIVVHDSVKGIERVEDLAGREVCVRKSSSYYESLVSLNDRLSSQGLEPVRIVEVDETLETEDILEMVNSGALDITVSDSHIAEIWSEVFNNIKVLNAVTLRKDAKIAWMVRKNNPLLKESLNAFVKKRRQGTFLGNLYFNRYFKDSKWIKNPLALEHTDEQKKAVKLIKKYSDMYGFDWMFILALAYQESGLNQNKKSRREAVGIMQLKISTAASPAVGISDISSMDNNIHAGIKYLAHLRDNYFDDPEISERDRIRFALAAYNAGPTKVARMRALAGKMGLDANRWFRNVEIAALRLVGQETVRYVSNINKYYLAYRLHYESDKFRDRIKESLASE
jgi:membrane-bound lytic murein transglycosylase MltF